MTKMQKQALGRGLNALFGDEEPDDVLPRSVAQENTTESSERTGGSNPSRRTIGIAQIVPGKYQPRHVFNVQSIEELAKSIEQHGLIQPILVRPLKDGQGNNSLYEIVAGERRWRAAQKAQLHEVPVIIRDMEDTLALEIALIENLQREDLNPIDEAQALAQLLNDFKYTQEKVAEKVGKSRSYVANMLRLVELHPKVADLVKHNQLSAGHARALLTLSAEQQITLAHKAVEQHLNVRQVEKMVTMIKAGSDPKMLQQLGDKINKGVNAKSGKDVNTLALEKEISSVIGMNVSVDMTSDKAGKLSIEFKSLDQLDDIIRRLSNGAR